MAIRLSSSIAFPFLVFASVPLAFFAVITVSLSLAALFLRASLVYIELFLALARNYVLAIPDPSSSLNIAASGTAPSSPTKIHSRGLHRSHQYYRYYGIRTISPSLSPGEEGPWRRRSAGSAEGGTAPLAARKAPHQHKTSLPLPTAFRALTSGSHDRDFEGIGGWRSLSPIKHRRRKRTSRVPADEDPDEDKTWISFNRRLELPSLPAPFVTSPGALASSNHGLGMTIGGGAEEEGEGGGGDGRTWPLPSNQSNPGVRRRHHQRSITTSFLPRHTSGEIHRSSSSVFHPERQGQQHPSPGSKSPRAGASLGSLMMTAPAHVSDVPSESYFSLSRGGGDGTHPPSLVDGANIGKSVRRHYRLSSSSGRFGTK